MLNVAIPISVPKLGTDCQIRYAVMGAPGAEAEPNSEMKVRICRNRLDQELRSREHLFRSGLTQAYACVPWYNADLGVGCAHTFSRY